VRVCNLYVLDFDHPVDFFFFFPVCMLMVYSLPHTPARKARRRFSYVFSFLSYCTGKRRNGDQFM
jgi:hypothetical protein